MHTVLLVEDDPRVRDRLARAVAANEDLNLLAAVGTCAEARQALAAEIPEILLVDLGLPDGSGLDLIQEVNQRTTEVQVLIITRRLMPDGRPMGVATPALLTSREREVLQLIAKGFSYVEVGAALHVSVNTVASHIKRIYRKLAVNSRSEAVFEAAGRGLITMPR